MGNVVYEIDQSSLADRVYRYVKGLILSGELKGGEIISERELANRFGLSRTPLREALHRLEEYGLIRTQPRSSAQIVSLFPDEAVDVAHVRVALETLGVRFLIERGHRDDIDAIEEIATKCEKALKRGRIAESFEYDSQFHLEISRRGRNRHLHEQYQRLDAKVQLLRLVLRLPRNQLERFVAQHRNLVDAIRQRDEAHAVELTTRHVLDQLLHNHVVGGDR